MADQRLDLHQDWAGPFHGTGHYRTGGSLGLSIQHKFRRVLHLFQSGFPHLKHANLIGRAKTVFHAAQDTVRSMPVPFKIQYRIHHMLQYPRACHHAFFCHMAYNKYCYIHPFCNLKQTGCCFPYLGHAAWGRTDILTIYGLYGINDDRLRLLPFHHLLNPFHASLAEQAEPIRKLPDTLSPHLNLLEGFFPGNIEHLHGFCQVPAHLEQQGRLPNPWISAH